MSITEPQNNTAPQNEAVPVRMHLKWFNGTKGFGFVVPKDANYDAFLHVTTLQKAGVHSIGEGAELICSVVDGDKGKQVDEIIEVLSTGSMHTMPEIDAENGTYTMGGLVKWFKPDQGFGFIIPDDGMKDIFIHQSCLDVNGIEELRGGERVRVTMKDVDKGREAVKIEIIE